MRLGSRPDINEKRAGAQEFPVGQVARFVKVRLLDNNGADRTTLSEIAVIEGRRDGYTSVLLRDAEDTDDDAVASEEALAESETVPDKPPVREPKLKGFPGAG